ncbi:MAG TPA: FAD-dependent monooxygenase [Terrimesophilobacter sp.]|nr:FAD-dependent monooxygenase [Terrimesophilobacter sp.]
MDFDHTSPGGPQRSPDVDVVVVGAGPTGLTAAAEALRHGLSVRIIERKADRGAFSKALVVHARTLEVFETMGIARDILAQGVPFAALNIRSTATRRATRVDLLGLHWGDTAYPYWLSAPQYATELALQKHLEALGGAVEWSTTLQGFEEVGDHVTVAMESPDGPEAVTARWIIGCDGGQSTVRRLAGIDLKRTGAGTTFLLADVKTTLDLVEDEGRVFLAPEGLLIIVPMPEPRRWRIIAHVNRAAADPRAVDAAYLDDVIRQRSGLEFGSHDVTWTSQFDLSHGVADRFRTGRVFLAGDAAHIHSPVGGQGLNTGVQDAHNLMWKIALAHGSMKPAAQQLLDSYESERRGTALPMVNGVARVTALITARRPLVRKVLGRIAPTVLARRRVQQRLGRGVGMLNLAYATGRGKFGREVGKRLGNPLLGSGERLYEKLDPTGFTWVALGDVAPEERTSSAPCWRGLPVVFLPIDALAASSPAVESRVVLVRPDRYIAAAGPNARAIHWEQGGLPLSANDAVVVNV